jgi:surface antigen
VARVIEFSRSTLVVLALTIAASAAVAQEVARAPLTPADQAIADEVRLRTLETARSRVRVSWRGATAGVHGTIEPLRTYLARNGMMCREFEETTQLPDTALVANRLACRDDKGLWHIVR